MNRTLPLILLALRALAFAEDADPLRREVEAALKEKDAGRHKALILDQAKRGSLDAGARMIDLAMWDEMESVPAVVTDAWADKTDERIGDKTARQIAGVVSANRDSRIHRNDTPLRESKLLEARKIIERDTFECPLVTLEMAWMYKDVPPADKAKAEALTEQARGMLDADILKARNAADILRLGTATDLKAYHTWPAMNPRGNWEEARRLFAEASRLHDATGNRKGRRKSLQRQALCTQPDNNPKGDWEEARRLLSESARLSDDAGDKYESLYLQALCTQPDINPKGDWEEARRLYAESARLIGDSADKWRQGNCLYQQGYCTLPNENPKGDWEEARRLFAEASRLYDGAENRKRQGDSLQLQALCTQPDNNPKGDWEEARRLYAEAARLGDQAGDKDSLGLCLQLHAWCTEPDNNPKGDWVEAQRLYAEAARLHGKAGDKAKQGACLFHQAVCMGKRKKELLNEEARKLIQEAARLMREAGQESSAKNFEKWIR